MLKLKSCPICENSTLDSYIETKAQMHPSDEVFNFDQCSSCSLVFLNPRVSQNKLKNYYTSFYLPYRGSSAWGKFEKIVEASQKKLDKKRVSRIRKTQKITNKSIVLDIGCGSPSFLKTCQESLKCNLIGIDFSEEGWKNHTAQYEGIDLRVAQISELENNLCPDIITMWHYLEHDYKPKENLNYLRSISKPSTALIIEIPNFDSLSRKKFGKNWAGWHTPRHLSLFSPNNINLLLKKTGWKAEKIITYGSMNPYLLYWMSLMEKKGIQWNKNMEEEFKQFVIGMIKFLPMKLLEKKASLGIMTVVAKPDI